MTVIDATAKFARRTAEACINDWDRTTTIACMKRMGDDHEMEVVRQIEQIQLERMRGEEDDE